MTEENYYDDLSIDPNQLENEWFRQPALYAKYSELAADAIKERDEAKENLDVIKGQMDKKIRLSPKDFGLESIKEAAVTFTILQSDEYKDANKELIETTYRLNLVQGVVKALDHKKKALESTGQLWIGTYWSTPHEPVKVEGTPKSFRKSAQDNVVVLQREAMNKKRRKRIIEPDKDLA